MGCPGLVEGSISLLSNFCNFCASGTFSVTVEPAPNTSAWPLSTHGYTAWPKLSFLNEKTVAS
jgi:hypothetical protein